MLLLVYISGFVSGVIFVFVMVNFFTNDSSKKTKTNQRK